MSERVGFVGLGRMGHEMSSHLVRAGFEVVGVDPDPAARARAEEAGVQVTARLDDLSGLGVVLSSLPGTTQMQEVYGGPEGVFSLLGSGALCIDLSTVSVAASQDLARDGARLEIDFLDAPVSGTSTHAAAGTLAVMVGGPAAAVERARAYLDPFSDTVRHCGPAGSGLETKLVTNRLLTTHLVAIGEAILELERAGLDVDATLDLLRSGAVPRLLEYKAPAMSARDFSPLFTVALMAKDLGLADERRPPGRVTAAAVAVMREALESGHGSEDIAAVMAVLEAEGDVSPRASS
jgi:3-hydroxyisobutyrate dehydrogenase-like beta-hydroxyacid dehydrogenase